MRKAITLLLVSFSFISLAQIIPNLNSIPIPDNQKGFITLDIITTDGGNNLSGDLIFLYSLRKILVLNASDYSYVGEINISSYGKNSEQYDELHRIPAISYMAYNTENNELYFFVPDMTIGRVQIDQQLSISNPETIIDLDGILLNNGGVNGYPILRFNNITQRLYWVVNGTNLTDTNEENINCFFGIYKRNMYAIFSPICDPIIYNENIDIYDIAFNVDNDALGDDYFYLSRDNCWRIYKISNGNNLSIVAQQDLENNPQGLTVKNGWFLYAKDANSHKIFCLPHDNHFDENPQIEHKIYVIDGDANNGFDDTGIQPPSSMVIYSGDFYTPTNGNSEIILGILPGETEELIYRYDATNYNQSGTISLDGNKINYCKHILIDGNNNLILCRKDCISQYNLQNGGHTYLREGHNNYYYKSVEYGQSTDMRLFIPNPISSGLEILNYDNSNSSWNWNEQILCGQALYSTVFNPQNECFYCFSRTDFENGSIYLVDEDNSLHTLSSPEDAIGDVIYNPFTQQMLLSTFADNAEVLSYTDDINAQPQSQINNLSFAEKMFITPDKRLIMSCNMSYQDGVEPRLKMCSAEDYSDISLSNPLTFNDLENGIRIKATYSYNQNDNIIYSLISPVENTATNLREGNFNTGHFIQIYSDDSFSYETVSFNPRQAIFSTQTNRLFVSTSNGIKIWNGSEWILQGLLMGVDIHEMSYDPLHDKLFVIGKESSESKLWEIDCQDILISEKYNFSSDARNATSIIFNNLNNSLAIMSHPLNTNFSDRNMVYYEFDLFNNYAYQTNYTGNMFMPARDLNFHYQQNQFVLDPINLKLIYPNGMYSNIIYKVFNSEVIYLQDGAWSWVSFPRMDREYNNAVSIIDILGGNIVPDEYPFIIQSGSKLQYYNYSGDVKTSYYDPVLGWNHVGQGSDLFSAISTYGYKIYINYGEYGQLQPEQKWLNLQGVLYDLNTHFDPNCNNCTLSLNSQSVDEYWVGYYHTVSQNIPDALPDEIESKIHIVKGQYFTCYNEENQGDGIIWSCVCNKGSTKLDYGDMVIITPKPGETIDNFYWALHNNSSITEEKAATEYYAFTETADYTPIFVELDTSDNPLEIGAFIEDSCIGATTVVPEDAMVLIAAYSDNLSGEIYFEEYYGMNKDYQPAIFEYYVKDPVTRQREKRLIHTSENQDYYVVSFNNGMDTWGEMPGRIAQINCWPNPVQSDANLQCFVPREGYVEIKLINVIGTEQMALHSGIMEKGTHNFTFSVNNLYGRQLSNGIYILSIASKEWQAQTKIVVLQ
jgi:hypothetical protein